VTLPSLAAAGRGLVVPMALVQTSALLARRCQATRLTMLVHRIADPVDARIAADSLVVWIYEDDFKVFVRGILVDPVRVEHTHVGAATAYTLLGRGTQRALVFELVDTLVCGFTIGGTLGGGALAVTATDSDTVDCETLFGFISRCC
jgi:hypothetical protein